MDKNEDREIIAKHICDSATPVSVAIVHTLASVKEIDPLEIDFTLYDHTYPEALNMILCHDNTDEATIVRFPVENYMIEIDGGGNIAILE